ncbi:hypothetical protein V1505DRAFT_380162 [Lipomyces doorenjongii]
MVPPPTLAPAVIPTEEQLPQMAIVFKSSAISAKSQSADELSRRGDATGRTDSEWTAKSVAVTNALRSRRKRRRVLEPDDLAPAFSDSGIPHAPTGKGDSARNRQHGIILHQDELTEEHKQFATQHLDIRTTRLDTDIDALLDQALPDPLTTHDDPDAISIRGLKQLIVRHRALLAARLLVAKRRRELDIERVRRVTIAERENIWVRHLSKRFDLRADMISEVGKRIEFVTNGMTCAQVPDDWSEDDCETDNDDGPVNIGEQNHQVPSVYWRDEPVTKGLSIDEISDDVALIRNGKRHEQVIPQSPDLKLINEEDQILGDLVTTLVDIHQTCTPAESVERPSTAMLSLYIASIQVENNEPENEANKFPADQAYQRSAKIQAENDHHQQHTPDPDKLSPPEMASPPKPDVHAPQLTQSSPPYQQETAPDSPYPRHRGDSEHPPNTAQDPEAPPPPTPHYNYGYSQSFMQPPPPAYPPPPQQQPPYSPEYDYRQDPHPEARYGPIHQKLYVQAQHQHPQQPEYYHSYSLQQAPYPPYPHPPQMTPQDQPYYPPQPQQRQRQYPLPPPPMYQQQQGWHQQPSPPQRYQSQYPSQQQQQQQQQQPPPPPPQQAYPPRQYSQGIDPRSQQAFQDSAPPPPDYAHHSRQYNHPHQDSTFAPQQNYASPQNGQYGEHHYQRTYNPPAPYSAQSAEYQYNTSYQPQYSYPPPPPPPLPPHQRVQGEQYNYSHQQDYQYQQQYSYGGAKPEGYPPASYQHGIHNPAPPMYTTAAQSTYRGPVHVKNEPVTAPAPTVIHNGEQGYMPESRREIIAGGSQSHGALPDYGYSPDQQARHHDQWHTYPSRQSQQQQQYGGDTPRYEYSAPPEWSGPPGSTYQNCGPPPSRYGPPGSHYGEQYSQGTPNRLSRSS